MMQRHLTYQSPAAPMIVLVRFKPKQPLVSFKRFYPTLTQGLGGKRCHGALQSVGSQGLNQQQLQRKMLNSKTKSRQLPI